MEQVFSQREWQHIPLKPLASGGAAQVADRALYSAFYERWLAKGQALSPEWLAVKRRIGEWLEAECVAPLRTSGSVRVFSVGAGLGVVERALWERGCRVDVLECEGHSLRYLATQVPGVLGVIGDARQLPCRTGLYDVVYLSTVDYCFDHAQYVQVLREMGRIMRPEGRAVVICTSNLSLIDIARGAVKRVVVHRSASHDDGQVLWGYRRTVGAHLRAGRAAGLVSDGVYLFDQGFRLRTIRRSGSWHAGWPTLGEAMVAVVFKQSGDAAT